MTPIVQSLNEEWASIASSPTARRALMRWATANPVLSSARCLADLVDTRSQPAWGREAHLVLAGQAPVDHLAARTLLQALLGGLVRLSHKVGDGDPDGRLWGQPTFLLFLLLSGAIRRGTGWRGPSVMGPSTGG